MQKMCSNESNDVINSTEILEWKSVINEIPLNKTLQI